MADKGSVAFTNRLQLLAICYILCPGNKITTSCGTPILWSQDINGIPVLFWVIFSNSLVAEAVEDTPWEWFWSETNYQIVPTRSTLHVLGQYYFPCERHFFKTMRIDWLLCYFYYSLSQIIIFGRIKIKIFEGLYGRILKPGGKNKISDPRDVPISVAWFRSNFETPFSRCTGFTFKTLRVCRGSPTCWFYFHKNNAIEIQISPLFIYFPLTAGHRIQARSSRLWNSL